MQYGWLEVAVAMPCLANGQKARSGMIFFGIHMASSTSSADQGHPCEPVDGHWTSCPGSLRIGSALPESARCLCLPGSEPKQATPAQPTRKGRAGIGGQDGMRRKLLTDMPAGDLPLTTPQAMRKAGLGNAYFLVTAASNPERKRRPTCCAPCKCLDSLWLSAMCRDGPQRCQKRWNGYRCRLEVCTACCGPCSVRGAGA